MSSPGVEPTRALPPGQRRWPQLQPVHDARISGIDLAVVASVLTHDGKAVSLSWTDLMSLPKAGFRADRHCVWRYTTLDLQWSGIAARSIIDLVPPGDDVQHVRVSAARGDASSIRLEDRASPRAVFATDLDGQPLSPEHGWPLRLVLPHV